MSNQQSTIGSTTTQEIPIEHDARLTTGEIAQLWATYMQYSMLTCIFKYFERVVQEPPIKELVIDALNSFESRVSFAADAFRKENFKYISLAR